MRAAEFKKLFDSIRERNRVAAVIGEDYVVYGDHFEIPYRMVASHRESGADVTLYYGKQRVAYVKLGSVTSIEGAYS